MPDKPTEFSAFLQSLYSSQKSIPVGTRANNRYDFYKNLILNTVNNSINRDPDELINFINSDTVNRIFNGTLPVAISVAKNTLGHFSEENFSRYIENKENFNQVILRDGLKSFSVPDAYINAPVGMKYAALMRQYLEEIAKKEDRRTHKQDRRPPQSLPAAEPYINSYYDACPSAAIGIDGILDQLHTIISDEPHFALLCGRNGVGKKTICQAFLKKYSKEYSVVVYLRYRDSLMQTVCEDVPIVNFNRKLDANGQSENLDSYFRRKLDVIKTIAVNQPILFVLADYDPSMDDEEWRRFRSLLEINNASFLISTSRQFTEAQFQQKSVSASLDTEALKDIFFQYYTTSGKIQRDDPLLTNLINDCLGKHTLAVKVAAKYLMSTRSDLGSFLANFQEQGLRAMGESVILDDFGRSDIPANAIVSLFNLSGLSDRERNILELVCLCAPSPIRAKDMLCWASLTSLYPAQSLFSKGWIEYDTQTDAYSVNPIVRQTVLYHDPARSSAHGDFLLKMAAEFNEQDQLTWSSEDKKYYARLVDDILSHIGGITEELLPFFMAAERILVYGGKRDQSYALNLDLDEYLRKDEENNALELAVIRYCRGWTLITQRRQPKEGLQLLQEARPMMVGAANRDDPRHRSYLSDLYADIGLQSARSEDVSLRSNASRLLEQAIAQISQDDSTIRRRCWLKGLLAECYIKENHLCEAKRAIDEGYDLYGKLGEDSQSIELYRANLLFRQGMVSRIEGEPEDALNAFVEAQEIYNSYYWENYPSNVNHFRLIADQYEACGNDGEAKKYRERALRVAESVFDEDSPVIKSCQEALQRHHLESDGEEAICRPC